ncbi:enoyl-CoA delta isomerase 1, mitochondrial-like isoform X2 [Ostrinia furnacalis]|uniref:enoyl-CoA delta isomerase 1, mitochondrial-like isoform X2 n=1 Tax=Ostrinia furnacalis TaxID=93504 RepID=UPI00103C47EF|nr:enoyl-CoA delta isomerase 1, mitochondrial-like isoform X2 [Ostrinia furnacalis]
MLPLRFFRASRRIVPAARSLSSDVPSLDLSVDSEGIATLTMQRLPVNSLNLEVLQEFDKALDEVEKIKAKGLIITSASSTVFSAGLDIREMYKPETERMATFASTLQNLWLKLYGSPYPTAAAITGHAPAGGCLIAMSCEYRAMVNGNFRIGLNETALGIVASSFFIDTMRSVISRRETELALTTGRMFFVDEALKVGLIDETTTDKADAIEKCKNFIKRFDKIPPLARGLTKQRKRIYEMEHLQNNSAAERNESIHFITQPEVQHSVGTYLEKLKQKAAK